MKIISKNFDFKAKNAKLKLIPENCDDIYNLYNLIDTDDLIKAFTYRKVDVGNKKTEKVKLLLELKVKTLTADIEVGMLFVKGTVNKPVEHVHQGAHHTINISLNTMVTITKTEFTNLSLKFLTTKTEAKQLMYILMTIKEILFYEVTENFIKMKQKMEYKPKNFKSVMKSAVIQNLINYDSILIGSSTDVNLSFKKNLLMDKSLKLSADKILCLDVDDRSSNHKAAIEKSMLQLSTKNKILSMQYLDEIAEMNLFMENQKEGKMTCVGFDDVEESLDYGAAKSILISNDLFKKYGVEVRKRADDVCKLAKSINAKVCILPATFDCGEFLVKIGGIGANLRFEYRDEHED